MEQKKSNSVNLERKRGAFFFMGLVMTTAVIGMAFEYENFVQDTHVENVQNNEMEVEMVFEIPEEEEIIEEKKVVIPPPVIEEIILIDDEEEPDDLDLTLLEEEVEDPSLLEDPDAMSIVEEEIYLGAEVSPEFPGGANAMYQWIGNEIKYPELAAEMGEQGQVKVQFVVNKDGSIEQVKIYSGVSDALDAEAIRVVKKMPKWRPGENMGKKVRTRFLLPIYFRLG